MPEKDAATMYKKDDLKNLNFYYGVSSDCLTSFKENEHFNILDAIKSLGLDYAIISHGNKDLDCNLNGKNEHLSVWQYLSRIIYKFNKKNDDFLALLEFEASIESLGKVSILNTKTFFKGDVDNFRYFAVWLIQNTDFHINLNISNKSINQFPYKDFLNEIYPTIDINIRSDKDMYSNKEKCYFSLLDNGFKVGAIGQKNYKYPPYSNFSKLTCIICPKLDTKNLISALNSGHCFFTESKTLKLLFSINDIFMGSSISKNSSSDLNIYIYAHDSKHKISKIEILSNQGIKVKELIDVNLNRVQYIFKKSFSLKETWYVVKVFLDSNLTAISSPIFIK